MSSPLREIDHCEVCGVQHLEPVLDLGLHPMCDDLVPVGDARICAEYPIQIAYCATCRTAHQRFQIPKENLFPQTYHYRSRHTADVLTGMSSLVDSIEQRLGSLAGRKVLDIGCNDGSLLGFFRQHGAHTCGIEPTGAHEDAAAAGHVVLHDYLTEEVAAAFVTAHGTPDVITFTNVFAHIEDLSAVLRALSILKGPATAIVIENHYLGQVLKRRQFDTFYHEHPRTYSYTSFTYIAARLGMHIALAAFPIRYGGNIRVLLLPDTSRPHDRADELTTLEAGFGNDFQRFAVDVASWRERKLTQINDAVRRFGPLVAKAFPGRAAIPVRMLELDVGQIRAAYEKPKSGKIGHYLPGTRIPILSDETILADHPEGSPIVNFAWHISTEIESYLMSAGYTGKYINIISPDDFS